jgi:hypothetical protein
MMPPSRELRRGNLIGTAGLVNLARCKESLIGPGESLDGPGSSTEENGPRDGPGGRQIGAVSPGFTERTR